MEYVEILRSRKVLIRWSVIIAAVVLLWAIGIVGHNVQIKGKVPSVPASVLISLAAFGAFILASIVAPGLNNEWSTIAITWTRPTTRRAIAWRFIAVDLVTIAVGSAILALAILIEVTLAGLLPYVRIDALAPNVALQAVACAVMWYALCLLAASRAPERAGLFAGLSWAVFLVLGVLASIPMPPVIHALAIGLNYLNPLAYFTGSEKSGSLLEGPLALRVAMAWLIGIVSIVAAVRLWSTREA